MIHRGRFLDFVDRFRSARILVIGPAVAEVDVHCAVDRLAPDRAMPVYRRLRTTVHPGGAALTAMTARDLGACVTLLAPFGSDGEAVGALREILDGHGLHCSGTGNESAHAPELHRYLTSTGRQLLQIRKGWSPGRFDNLERNLSELMPSRGASEHGFDCVCIVDGLPSALGPTEIGIISRWAKSQGIPLIFDAAGAGNLPEPQLADHVIVNEAESVDLARALGITSVDDHIERLRRLCQVLQAQVLLTLGRNGAVLGKWSGSAIGGASGNDGDGEEVEICPLTSPSHPLSDRRGLGFVVSGTYAIAVAVGAKADEAAFLACQAAGAAAAQPGPKRVKLEQILQVAYREIDAQIVDGVEIFGRIARDHLPEIDRAARLLLQAFAEGKQALVFGNGGSAAQANHLVTELTGRFRAKRPALPAICLSSNDSLTTCIANDYGYDEVYAHQIEAFCREGDIVLGLSTSGRSPNVIRAMEQAQKQGARIIAFTGRDAGRMGELADVVVAVPSDSTPRVQEAHLFVIHVMCDMLDSRLDASGRLRPSASEI